MLVDTASMKTVWRFLKTLKMVLPYDPAIPLLGIYPEEIIVQKDTGTPLFFATSTFDSNLQNKTEHSGNRRYYLPEIQYQECYPSRGFQNAFSILFTLSFVLSFHSFMK